MWKCFTVILFLFPCVLLAGNRRRAVDCVPVITIAENKNNVCLNTSITIHATVVNEGTNGQYKWKRNDADVNVSGADYTAADFHEGDVVTCAYSCTTSCGTDTTVSSGEDTIHVINDITPIIAVANNDSIICEGELTVFTTQAFYGSAIPSYQWKLNDEPINDTTPSYPTDTLTNGSKVECVLTISTPGCPGTASSTSWMTIYVYPMIHPAIKITPSKTDICRGEEVTFTATANGGAYPSFSWEINGKATAAGPELISDSLKDGDTVSCTVTIDQDSRCHSGISAASNKVVMHVKDYVDPAVAISAPVLDACVGTPLTFIATPTNAGDYTLYQWNVNDHSAGGDLSTFITDQLKNGDKVSCLLSTDIPGCSFTAGATSNYEVVTIRDTPDVMISPADTSILSGASAQLNATVSGSIASIVWQPDNLLLTPQSLTSATQPLEQTTTFMLTVTDIHGCKAGSEALVKVLYKTHIPSAFTPNKDGKNDVFRIPPGSSLVLERFSVYDRWGHIIFETSNISKGWDGTYRGINWPVGTYIYLVKGTVDGNEVIEKGTVTLIR